MKKRGFGNFRGGNRLYLKASGNIKFPEAFRLLEFVSKIEITDTIRENSLSSAGMAVIIIVILRGEPPAGVGIVNVIVQHWIVIGIVILLHVPAD